MCRLCHQATMHPIGTLQCRVCSSVTHDQCLTARSKDEADIAQKNYKTIGWSCDNCVKVSFINDVTLLSPIYIFNLILISPR